VLCYACSACLRASSTSCPSSFSSSSHSSHVSVADSVTWHCISFRRHRCTCRLPDAGSDVAFLLLEQHGLAAAQTAACNNSRKAVWISCSDAAGSQCIPLRSLTSNASHSFPPVAMCDAPAATGRPVWSLTQDRSSYPDMVRPGSVMHEI
jgi:hypothetical protein